MASMITPAPSPQEARAVKLLICYILFYYIISYSILLYYIMIHYIIFYDMINTIIVYYT